MLQMTSLELHDLIEQEMVVNPVLEEVQSGDEVEEISESILDQNSDGSGDAKRDASNEEADIEGIDSIKAELQSENGQEPEQELGSDNPEDPLLETEDSFEEIDFGREFQDYLDPGYRTQEIEYKEDAPSFEQFLSHKPSLTEHLQWQLNMVEMTEVKARAVDEVIGNLDSDGRLVVSSEEIAELSACSVEVAEKAIRLVMSLDPVGCGARSVTECLLAQLESMGEKDSFLARLVTDHLEDLQPHRLQHLSNITGMEVHELNDVINKIRDLDPYPGRRYSSEEAIFVAPEVYIEKIENDYVIYFADDGSPRLRISPTYRQILEQKDATKETKDFIKDNVRSAVDLLRNIEHRRQTIYRVVQCIVDRQTDFLDRGVEYIKPMMLKDVAEDIGMHLSTISRVVNRKYAHTPQGVIELRRFFSEGMMNEDGEEVSTRILKLKIKKMVEEEDTKKPLTDEQIAKVLSSEGVKLSRRTVAKYRDQMSIPGSRERKTVI